MERFARAGVDTYGTSGGNMAVGRGCGELKSATSVVTSTAYINSARYRGIVNTKNCSGGCGEMALGTLGGRWGSHLRYES
jgi:hypothetical protein